MCVERGSAPPPPKKQRRRRAIALSFASVAISTEILFGRLSLDVASLRSSCRLSAVFLHR